MKRLFALALLLLAPLARGAASSPLGIALALEARMAAGDGVTLPDPATELVRHAGTVDLSEGDWPAAFHARAGETICVAVSPFTGDYEFFDESSQCFFTLVPVLPTTENWVAPFRHAEEGTHPDDALYAPWRLVDVWTLSHAESAEFSGRARSPSAPNLEPGSLRTCELIPTNLCFTAFSYAETNLNFTAAWPTNESLPDATLDLYGSTNLLDPRWLFLSSHPATTNPVSFAVARASLPWYVEPAQHVHDATCVSVTNIVLSPLDGTTVYTNAFWSCSTNRTPGEVGFFRLGTHHDTDGDGLPDAYERLVLGTDPANPDTAGDGVPDGLTTAQWLSHPLWANNGDGTNLVVFLYEPITDGVAALRFDDLCIPLSSNAGPWCLCIPTNAVVECSLVAEPGVSVMLWYGPPEAAVPTRSLVPGWNVPFDVAEPIWCDRPFDVFGGNNQGGGSCRFARPTLRVRSDEPGQENSADVCVHGSDGLVRFSWSVEPAACTGLWAFATGDLESSYDGGSSFIDVNAAVPGESGARTGTLFVESVSVLFFSENVLFGALSATLSAHRCLGLLDNTYGFCLSCGVVHGDRTGSSACYHEPWCATKSDLGADCDCAAPFVRIGSALGLCLVGDPELSYCCHAHADFPYGADLMSAPSDLGASISNGVALAVAPESRSPTIGGFVAHYRILDGNGGGYRDLSLPFTCADLGIDPCLADAQVPFEWEELAPEAYYLQDGTFYVARRADPYPIRLWNESPSDARLVFAFATPTNGPTLRETPFGIRHSAFSITNTAPFAALNDDHTVYLDALCSNALATLSLTLSDPATNRTFLSESLSVKVVDTEIGEHWRVRSASDTLSWDFTDAPEDVYACLWRPNACSAFGDLVDFKLGKTPSFSLDLPPGDYLLEAYFPRVHGGGFSAAWSTNHLHVVHTEVTPSNNLRFTNAVDRACFALTNNNGQAANWTISPVVAGGPTLFSSKTGGAGSAARLDNATSVWVRAGTMPGNYTITATHPHCPASTTNATFTVGRIDVESLLFNWDTTSSTNDAINLRWNYKDEINLATGEWTRAGYRAPACYVTNAWPIIRATFSAAPADLSSVTLLADTDAAIGGFAATNVAFAAGAASDVALSTQSTTTNCILKESFDLTWKAVVSNGTEVVTNTLGRTDGHVFYTILGEPKLPWTDSIITNQNVWASVLDFLSETDRCLGATTADIALKKLTEYLFAGHGLTYDTFSGGSAYIKFRTWDDASFRLDSYIAKKRGTVVNCYDQACSLAILGRSLGLDATIVYMEPFGFIHETSLVGGIRSNNPFFSNPRYDFHAVCPTNSPNRSGFRKHMFATQAGMAFDACAGPVTGQWTRVEYIEHVIDTNRVSTRYPTGTDADANPYLGIREVIE